MSKERITAYLTEKANKHEISFTDIPIITDLIEGYLKYKPKEEIVVSCGNCKYRLNPFNQGPCYKCFGSISKPNFEPK
jgi:hypothetical protein